MTASVAAPLPATMRAVVCAEFAPLSSLRLSSLPVPAVPRGSLLVRVRAASVSFLDTLLAQGKYQVRPKVPFVPGSEYAGEVAAVGEGVAGWQVGDGVVAGGFTGGLAEYAVCPAEGAVKLPPGMSAEDAAGFRVGFATAWHALVDRANAQKGEWLLVLGAAGAVGAAAVRVGKALGMRVIAAASNPEKRDYALRLGAEAAVDYTAKDFRQQVNKIVGERGVDVVFDPVGGDYAEPAFRCLAWKGRHLVVGFAAGNIPRLPFNLALLKGAALVGVDLARFGNVHEPEKAKGNAAMLVRMCTEGKLEPVPATVVPLERFSEAFELVAGRKALGRVVVVIGDDSARGKAKL
ncbi:oxidoreductase [Hyaloraphidium curvatum]|nr:oxidoreductase [Hyaloraphidium curvatum]